MAEVSRNKVWTICFIMMALVATAVMLIYTKTIMIPFILALLIAFIIAPAIKLLQEKAKFPRWLAIVVTTILLLLGLSLLALMITGTIKGAMNNIDLYKERVVALTTLAIDLGKKFGFDSSSIDRDQILSTLNDLPLFSYAKTFAAKLMGGLSNVFLVTIFVIFLLSGQSFNLPAGAMWREIEKKIRTYLVTKAITSSVTGILTAIILGLFGLDMAVMFGLLAFILNFIPTVGSMVAILLPIPIALFQFTTAWPIIGVILFPGAVQMLIGNILEPKFMGESLDLHPITILIALMFWGLIWGIPGMLLATPFTVVMRISLQQVEGARFFTELMAGRFPQDAEPVPVPAVAEEAPQAD